jgi:hypothetical protein
MHGGKGKGVNACSRIDFGFEPLFLNKIFCLRQKGLPQITQITQICTYEYNLDSVILWNLWQKNIPEGN